MLQRLEALKKSKKGFTLIELIVVIAILAILMAIAVPSYMGLKRSSAEQVAKANARSCYTAIKAAEATYNDKTTALTTSTLATNATTMLGDVGGTLTVTELDTATGYVTFTWAGTVGSYSLTATGTESNTGVEFTVADTTK